MLFVRNPTGVSHSPAEHAERDDCLAGVAALATVVESLAGEQVAASGATGSGPGEGTQGRSQERSQERSPE
jgi:N-carbamoyl-L-amino-acid hydrolase